MSGTAAVFIDAGYLDKVMYHEFQGKRIDFEKLVNEISDNVPAVVESAAGGLGIL